MRVRASVLLCEYNKEDVFTCLRDLSMQDGRIEFKLLLRIRYDEKFAGHNFSVKFVNLEDTDNGGYETVVLETYKAMSESDSENLIGRKKINVDVYSNEMIVSLGIKNFPVSKPGEYAIVVDTPNEEHKEDEPPNYLLDAYYFAIK